MYIPWLGARLMVTFQDIGINTDKRLFRGEVVMVEEVSIDELMGRMPKKKAAPQLTAADTVALAYTITNPEDISINITGDTVSITSPAGQVERFVMAGAAGGFTMTDSEGNVYRATVEDDGERVRVSKVGGGSNGSNTNKPNAGPADDQLDDFGKTVKGILIALRDSLQADSQMLQTDWEEQHEAINNAWVNTLNKRPGSSLNVSLRSEVLISMPAEDFQAYKSTSEINAQIKKLEAIQKVGRAILTNQQKHEYVNSLLREDNFFTLVEELKAETAEAEESNIKELLTRKINDHNTTN
jgi:hypothetical protein